MQAQQSTTAPRITAAIDNLSLTTLHGNVPRMARAEFDQGEAASATEMSHMHLVLARSAAQQTALTAYLAQLQDKSSPNYHKWLTPAQFGQLYGPAPADVDTLVSWLQSKGFSVDPVPAGRTDISFSGPVSQVEAAFHTSIHSFQANGTQFYSNTTDPEIPSALAPVVLGVAHLNTLRAEPQLVPAGAGRFNAETRQKEPLSAEPVSVGASAVATPNLTIEDSGIYSLYMVPGDAATIYDTPNAFNVLYAGTDYTGVGVKIGIGGDAAISASIVENYRSVFMGSSTEPTIEYCSSSGTCSTTQGSEKYASGDADEAYLDNELSGGMAPGASITYYATDENGDLGIEEMLTANVVDIFSLSFGECESDIGSSYNAQLKAWWEQAAAQGIAVTVSSGDSGSAACDGDNANPERVAVDGLSVSGYASTPYNIAVGGTDFYPLVNDFSTYASTSQGTSSSDYYRTANGYIPESTWNDSSYNDTTISDNVPLSDAGEGFSASENNIVAGSGGASSIYSKPLWQTGTGVPSDSVRDIPDVSLMSGNGFDRAAWLVCTDDSDSSGSTSYTTNCTTQSNGDFYFTAFGGTSTAAPAFAGILALVAQANPTTTISGHPYRLGQAAQTLYELYNGSNKSSIFHDVTVGNNSVACTSGTANCVQDSAGYYFESGYNTGSGYDMATGMGSVNATNLVKDWSSASGGLPAPTLTVTSVSPSPATTTDNIVAAVSVSGSGVTPTGTVTISNGSYTSTATGLSSGAATIIIPGGSLAAGTDTLTVSYSGDTNYAAATNSLTTVTVTGPSFSLSATTPTPITAGGSATSTITATGNNSYAGTITLTCALTSYPSGASYLPSCSGGSSTIALSSTTASGTATVTMSTTAATSALVYPKPPVSRGWLGAGGGAVLAFVVFLGIPARRRDWRSMLGVLMLLAALGSLTACGSGGSTTTTGTSGTTAGTYKFTVTGTGNDAASTTKTTTFSVVVN